MHDEDDMAEEAGTAVMDSPAAGLETTDAGTSINGTTPAPVVTEPVQDTPQLPVQLEPRSEPAREVRTETRTDPKPPVTPDTKADDTLIKNWRLLADPEFRDDPVLGKYETVNEALKALVHQGRLLGNSIQIPREGAGETQWRAIWEKLGCPKSAGEYAIADPDMGKDDDGNARGLAPNFLVSLLETAHTAGLNNQQAQALVNFAARTVVQSENIQAGEMAMRKAEGERMLYEAFAGDAASMLQKATMAISRLGEGRYGGGTYAQRAAEKIRSSPLGNDVDVIAALANLWDNMGEGQFIESSTGGGMQTRDAIMADIQTFGAVMNDTSKPLAERQAAQQKQYRLFQDLDAMDEAAARRQGMGMR